ncbi:glycosyl transferase family 1 [Neisseria meningitidis]|nr:glycosyl transferase family 1 [Neisseria meningitidis]
MPSETFQTAFLYYSGLTKIRTRRRNCRQYK